MAFLNLVVQKIIPNTIQDFMRAWLRQECRDFRIIFFKSEDESIKKAQKKALAIAENHGYPNRVFIASDEKHFPPANCTKILKDTLELPRDKLEVMRLCKRPSRAPIQVEIPKELEKPIPKVEKAFFRIIVPNCNNMAYVKKCLDSLLEQSFRDFAIIIVDDISTDGSDKVCQLYAKSHPDKIIFLKLEEKGYAGGARNKALDYPFESAYTMFLDSDDWMHDRDVLKKIHAHISKKKVLPKIVRCPLYHFLGVGARGNRLDNLPLGKMNILLSGCGPSRNCIKSELVQKFVENRSKSNDVVWFLRTIDKIKDSEISEVKFPCEVYNRISVTSCQNNVDVMISEKCVRDQKLLAEDLKKEVFTSEECIEFQKNEIWKREHLYKPTIQLPDLLSNSYVISIDQSKYWLFSKIFKNAGLQPTPILRLGSTIKGFTGPQNCAHSHIQVVKTAKIKDLPYVCVFEDDAFPCIDCAKKFSRYLDCIPYDADFVLLGWSNYNRGKKQRFNAPFNKIEQKDISGSHSYILFKSGYDKYLEFFEENPTGRADNTIFASVGKSYVLNYPLFIQYSESKSMNKHIGYIFYGDHQNPPAGFPTIDWYLKKGKSS